MLASAVHQLHQSAARSFSTAPVVCSKVLSPLNKTSLARQQRANKGLVKGGKRGKGKQTMTLEEASRVLAVSRCRRSPLGSCAVAEAVLILATTTS